MPVAVSYPGVYVQEQASGSRAVAGVSTSAALFVGMAERGRMDFPVRVTAFAEFAREFGDTSPGELALQVRQFFLNGGGEAFVCRIANGDQRAAVTLQSEAGVDVLRVGARDPGLQGDQIRLEVDYATDEPGETFTLRVFRLRVVDGARLREEEETFEGLSMDPASPRYAPRVVSGASALVELSSAGGAPPGPVTGLSVAAVVLPTAQADVVTALQAAVTAAARSLRLRVGEHPPVTVTLPLVAAGQSLGDIGTAWQTAANAALSAAAIPASVTVSISPSGAGGGGVEGGRLLRVTSTDGPVRIRPATGTDVTRALGLGPANGGLEGSGYGDARPAPTGLVSRTGTAADEFAALRRLAGRQRSDLTGLRLVDGSAGSPYDVPVALPAGGRVYEEGPIRSLAVTRAVLDLLAGLLRGATAGRWRVAVQGYRLALTPVGPGDTENTGPGAAVTTTGAYDAGSAGEIFDPAAAVDNVAAYTVGTPSGVAGAGPRQTAAVGGADGTVPVAADYEAAYEQADRELDVINLLVLPRAAGQDDNARQALWGPASAFCARRRAFLLADPRSDWTDAAGAEAGIDQLRIGVETRNAACWWPRLRVADGTRSGLVVDPAGSVAGLMARTDASRGVWKAPAGVEATIRGVVGVEHAMTDPDNGPLNKRALNAIRVFPAGVVGWGARTLVGFDGSGNIDDKYVPVRRTMLFIEESLYRGLLFAVFEPNDEPLWAQIRLAAGSFMNGLFRQGAFAGARAQDAYFVACDATTTTAADRDLGIVHVVVGFAPLKPAEFVVLTVTQLAGQDAV